MAHLQSQMKGGYYPLPPEHLPALASLFKATEGGLILDPCAGEGDALQHLASAWHMTPYANEIDQSRAAACREKFGMERTACGDLMTLRTPNRAYSLVYVNPPYAENSGRADEKRREFEMLAHSWKWGQDGGFVLWVVYAQHMTERAASFLVQRSSRVDVYRLPGLHLDTYPQIVVVAKARPVKREDDVSAEALDLVESCRQPDSLPLLQVVDEPVYRIPPAQHVKRFYFHPDDLTADLMQPFLVEQGTHRSNTFQAIVETPPEEPPLTPIVPPRSGQLGMILAAGLFNGLLLDRDGSPAAVRGVVRMTEIDTTPEELRGIRETIEHKAQVTITLLSREGKVTRIESHEKDRLVSFIKRHKDAFLAYLTENSQPLYDFDHSRHASVFDRVFRNRLLPGRPVTGLFETQKHVVAAMLATLEKRRKVILIGDMGTGKTPMAGAAIAALWHEGKIRPGQVAVIMCPPHLIHKWHSELVDVIPGCVPHVADKNLSKGETLVDDVTAFMQRAAETPDKLHILIVSRERAKLGEGWSAAYQVRHRRFAQWPKSGPIPRQFLDREDNLLTGVERIVTEEIPICPTCSEPISSSKDGKGKTDPVKWMQTGPRQCHACGGALWQYTRTFSAPDEGMKYPKRNPRYPVATLLRERFADRVAVAVIDEIHETKSAATDQGRAMQNLVHIAGYAIGLTGTLFGGMASSVFWLEWAFNPRMAQQYPIDEGVEQAINRWVRTMGVMVKVIEYSQDKQSGVYNGTDRHEHRPQEAPGISPLLIRELLDHCLWVGLPDLAFNLPDYKEIPVPVSLPPEIQSHYDREKQKLLDYLVGCKNEGDASFLGAYLHACLRYPSTCYQGKPVVHRTPQKDELGNQVTHLVTTLQGFGKQLIYPKEQALIDLLGEELAANRPCVIFIAQSGKHRIQDRLAELIQKHVPDAKPVILESNTVATDKRDRWMKKQVEQGCNLLICNPKLIETGLDCLWAKSLIFFEVAYSLYTISQASRRHWRIGQTEECRVYHLFYSDTMEAQAIRLVSEKQAAAALLGGDADGGGLAQLSGGALSLEAELAKSIAEDTQVVDVAKLFQQTAQASADFTSGWATGSNGNGKSDAKAVPLENLVGKRFYHELETHEVVDYGPLTEASYRVRNLVTGDENLLPADVVQKAKSIAHDLPLLLRREEQPPVEQPEPVLPRVPQLAGYHAARRNHAAAVVLVERGDYFYAYGTDAKRVAKALNAVLETRKIGGVTVEQTAVPAKDLDHYISRLNKAGIDIVIARRKAVKATAPVEAPAEHVLPATLPEAYARYRENRQPNILTFVEMPGQFISFDADALAASRRLLKPASVHVQKGGPSLQVFAIPKGEHEAAFERLLKADHTVALVNGRVELLRPAPTSRKKPLLPPRRSPEQLREISHGQISLF
ncbi:MAG: hypothetical protein JXJ17_12065 [Anaerolineae bacterium]|nr:hypothetical protein [Anaerolineae bacterium]